MADKVQGLSPLVKNALVNKKGGYYTRFFAEHSSKAAAASLVTGSIVGVKALVIDKKTLNSLDQKIEVLDHALTNLASTSKQKLLTK